MKILFIITGMGMGGAEKQLLSLANSLTTLGHTVQILSLLDNNEFTKDCYKNLIFKTLNLKKNLSNIFYVLIKFNNEYIKFNPDIVHSHMYHANIFSRILNIFYKFPYLINTAHSTDEGGFLRMTIYRFTDYLANITTIVSNAARCKYINLKVAPSNKIITIYNGIDTNKFVPDIQSAIQFRNDSNFNSYIILAVGRLVPEKDYPTLLRAFYEFQKIIGNSKLLIIGEGSQRSNIEFIINDLNLGDKVLLLGLKHNIYDYLNSCDLFVLPSLYEGFGLSVAEAMSMKKFVIATDCGGVVEILGDCGAIVPVADFESLATKMIQVALLDDEQIVENGNRSRNRIIDNFSMHHIVNSWIKIYERNY